MQEEAYNAWWELADTYDWNMSHIEITMMKVNPVTRKVEDDQHINTHIEYWVETGQFNEEFMAFEHDIRLDCGGDSYDEAIIKLLKLVRKFYKPVGK